MRGVSDSQVVHSKASVASGGAMATIVNPERDYMVYFKERSDKKGFYRCKLCSSDTKTGKDGVDTNSNSSALQAHIRKHSRPPPLPGVMVGAVLDFMVQDLHPLSMCSDAGFRAYTSFLLGPSCQLPGQDEVAEALEVRYASCRWSVGRQVSAAESISLSVERWKSNFGEVFLSVSAHFIDKDFKLNSVMLKTVCLGKGEEQKDVSEVVEKVLDSFDIKDKVTMAICESDLDRLDIEVVTCFASTLSKVVEQGMCVLQGLREHLEEVKRTLEEIGTIGELKVLQRNNDPETLFGGRKPTWLELYDVFRRQERLRTAIKAAAPGIMLNEENWEICRQVAQVLRPFGEVVQEVRARRFASASLVVVWANGLRSALDRLARRPMTPCVADLVAELRAGLARTLEDAEDYDVLATATLLDPRFREVPFRHAANAAIRRLTESTARELARRRAPRNDTVDKPVSVWDDTKARASWRGFMAAAKREVEAYLNAEAPQEALNQDPLEWWRARKAEFPHLARLATAALALPANASPFPDSELLVRRNNLGRMHVEQIVLLNANGQSIEKAV